MTRTLLLAAAAVFLPLTALQAQAPKPLARADFMKNIDARFNQMDTNHDGKVTKEEAGAELQRELQQANGNVAQALRAKFKQLDTNHDGQLSLAEFMAAQPGLHANQTADQWMQRIDSNHDGKVTREEFSAVDLANFNSADANHDGTVSPAEAQAYARAHAH